MTETLESLAIRLAQFKSTHENPEEMKACLDFCERFFDGTSSLFIRRIENNGVECLLVQTKETLEPDVLLIGHIDTVPGPEELFAGTVKDGWLYGRGTLDMKAFVATSLWLCRDIAACSPRPNINVLIVTDEELGGAYGARYMAEEYGLHPKIVLVPDDGEDISTLVSESKSIIQLKYSARGKESHACRPWDGKNAIELLYESFSRLASRFSECRSATEFNWVNTINLGTIKGGSATNEVPGSAEMTVDVRITHDTSREDVRAWAKDSLVPGVEYEIIGDTAGIFLKKEDPIVQEYVKAIRSVTGREPSYKKSGGGTDGIHFAKTGSVVITHQGTGADCQSDEERVYLPSLQMLVDIQRRFIESINITT